MCQQATDVHQISYLALDDVHLVVLSTTSDMVSVAVAGHHRSNNHVNYPFTSGGRVSQACSASDGFSPRCRNLPVVSVGYRHIVLAPFQNAVGLMELQYDGNELFKVRDFTLSITSETLVNNCTPLEIISFEGALIMMCLESSQTLRSCNIDIDYTNISQSSLSCVEVYRFARPIREEDYRYISNFVMYDDQRQVLFSVRGVIYGIRMDRLTGRPYSSLNDVSCDHLQYAGNHIFYAYCSSGEAKVYDTDQEGFHNANITIPFACPTSDEVPFTLLEVQQTDRDTIVRYDSLDYRTSGLNFTNGQCYDGDTFFLQDSVEGTKLFRRSLGTFRLISDSTRDRNLVVFDGPNLVVYRTGPSEVVLYDPSFQAVANIFLEMPVAVGIVTNIRLQPLTNSVTAPTATPTAIFPTPTPPSNTMSTPSFTVTVMPTQVTSATPLGATIKAGGWAGVGVAIGIVVLAIITVTILLAACR